MNLPLPRLRAEEIAEGRSTDECPVNMLDWYQLTPLFHAGLNLFGGAFYNDNGRSRRFVDAQLSHMCYVWRSKYGTCTPERSEVCQSILIRAFQAARTRPYGAPVQPYLLAILKRQTNDDAVHALMKKTIVPATYIGPAITVFKGMEDI